MSNSTLTNGKYTIELGSGATQVFAVDDFGNKQWVCSTTDPNKAMDIVEGLVMVETKRFYYPESKPTVSAPASGPVPPFLRKGNEAS
jgi:hypothetical protein